MGKAGIILKAAGGALAGTATIVGALRDNPKLAEGFGKAYEKVRSATLARSPKARFDAKVNAVEACADAVDDAFPGSGEPTQWRRRARTLRMRADLVWKTNRGKDRKAAMARLDRETAELLEAVNQRLVAMTNGEDRAPLPQEPDAEG